MTEQIICRHCDSPPDKIVADGCWCDNCQTLTTANDGSNTPPGFYAPVVAAIKIGVILLEVAVIASLW